MSISRRSRGRTRRLSRKTLAESIEAMGLTPATAANGWEAMEYLGLLNHLFGASFL